MEFLLKNASLTGLKDWLNDSDKKKSNGKKFTISNIQQYAWITNKLPDYCGGEIIIMEKDKYRKTVYHIVKNKE